MGKANREAAWFVIERLDLSVGAALLLSFVGDLVSDEGMELTAGCDSLAKSLHKPVSSVRRWRDELVSVGALTPMFLGEGGARSNTYRYTPPSVDGYPSTSGGVTPPRPLHDPSTSGREQEQEQEGSPSPMEGSVSNVSNVVNGEGVLSIEEPPSVMVPGGHVPRDDGRSLCGVKIKPDAELKLALDGRIPCDRCRRSWAKRRAA